MSALPEEPAWRRRAVERSTRAAKLRAEQRVQGLLDSARRLIVEKGTTDFTVQEVVERSRQSLRSFYQHFDGKHELLLALFEDALARCANDVREAAAGHRDPLERLRAGIGSLYEQSRPIPGTGMESPLFSDFAIRLLIRDPGRVAAAHLPLLSVMAELIEQAAEAGAIPVGRPRRQASLVMQTVMFAALGNGVPSGGQVSAVSSDEVWQFCFAGISGPQV